MDRTTQLKGAYYPKSWRIWLYCRGSVFSENSWLTWGRREQLYLFFSCSDVAVESDSILCQKFCASYDRACLHNETTSVSYHFFNLPSIDTVTEPAVLLNITAQGFVLIPQMFLHIMGGNEERIFDTMVEGERGTP